VRERSLAGRGKIKEEMKEDTKRMVEKNKKRRGEIQR
jgi:hypothetical protein